jgi:hypothetical protein
MECIEFFIRASTVRMRLNAFRHRIGDTSLCPWLIPHLALPASSQQLLDDMAHQTRDNYTLTLKSKFDYMGSVYEVAEELPNGLIRTNCRWGNLRGDEKVLTKDDVVRMANLKCGII